MTTAIVRILQSVIFISFSIVYFLSTEAIEIQSLSQTNKQSGGIDIVFVNNRGDRASEWMEAIVRADQFKL